VARNKLRFIVFQDGDWLCAQGVDFDLSVQARSLALLHPAIDKLIRGHIAVREHLGLRAFKDLPPAPSRFREMFEHSRIDLPPQIIASGASRKLPPPEVRIAVA
jgi:hypothetical protein